MGAHFPALPPFSRASSILIGCISSSLEGNGAIAIRSSKKGITINLEGKLLAKGKTAMEFATNFDAALAKAKGSTGGQKQP